MSQGVTDWAEKAIHDSYEVLVNNMPQKHRCINSIPFLVSSILQRFQIPSLVFQDDGILCLVSCNISAIIV